MSQGELEQMVEVAKARLTTIKFGDHDWKVTPFHFVVGDIIQVPVTDDGEQWRFDHNHMMERWWSITNAWHNNFFDEGSWAGFLESPHFASYTYPLDWKKWVARWRQSNESNVYRGGAKWMLSFTNNPLIVNELQLGEVSLASVENGKLVLTNFIDFPNTDALIERLKVYQLGELWLSYAQGGEERALRFGEVRPL